MDIWEKMHTGQIYDPGDATVMAEQAVCQERLWEYNRTRPMESGKRQTLLASMFAEIGEGCYIEPPLHANFGCKFVHFGDRIYANYNLTLVDDTHIYVGSGTMFGPNVTVATAGHPIAPELRGRGLQFNRSVRIGENCWLGAGVIVMPGVTIGDNTVIGAGSVVTKDIPAGVVALGNPCRVVREIGEYDRTFYYRDRRIDPELFAKK